MIHLLGIAASTAFIIFRTLLPSRERETRRARGEARKPTRPLRIGPGGRRAERNR
jgi:hypothetical protein